MKRAARLLLVLPAAVVALAAATPQKAARQQHQSHAGTSAVATVEAVPGAIVRWSVPGTRSCGMAGKTWRAIQETCYYPIDVERKPGTLAVTRHSTAGHVSHARITVLERTPETVQIQLGDIPQRNPTPADLQRNAREQKRLSALWSKAERPARFTLPLAPPVEPMPDGKGFGATWVFNTAPETSETHTGIDYAVRARDPVHAVADGVVVMADDLFYSGRSVFVDHGDGLITGYLHLSEMAVREGQEVRKGERLGLVGETGRTTGPHLHFAVRWHGARVNPALLLGDPAKMPAIEGR